MLEKNSNNIIASIAIILVIVNISSLGVTSHNDEHDGAHTNSSLLTAKSRAKRDLIFQPGSRILFRINVKDDIIRNNTIFSHGFGFRANIDLLQPYRPPKPKARQIRRRDVYGTLEELINQHGIDGRACILKSFCEASRGGTSNTGMMFKIFQLIFSPPKATASSNERDPDYPYLTSANECGVWTKLCPLSMLKISPYTDI